MPFTGEAITLTADERTELQQMTQSRTLPAGYVFRARLILMLADSLPYQTIQERLDTTAPTISRWKDRFLKQRVAGLLEVRHPGQKPSVITPALRAKVLEASRRKPNDGAAHWSCRNMAENLKISKDTVHRIWQQAGLKPRRLELYMASDAHDFERQAVEIIGLYLDPPQHAAVFCVDEMPAIQALARLDPVLPMSSHRFERHGFEHYPNGAFSLYAALGVRTGNVQGKTAAGPAGEELVGFLGQAAGARKPGQEIHVIMDDLSAHKSSKVQAFLDEHPNVHVHFTPTYSAWLNHVEIWFARLEREIIARGVFPPVRDLVRKLMRLIRACSKTARPFKWKYAEVRHRVL